MTPVFILPGWLNSGPSHWQSLWQAAHGDTRVEQHDWQRPLRGDWCARLEETVVNHLAQNARAAHCADNSGSTGIVLVAHSLGCHLVAAWAAASAHTSAVRGALLVAPPDVTQADLPPDMASWRKPVLAPLPFPPVCVVSSNDPFASHSAGQAMAAHWGARCYSAGPVGHINGDSGLGHWPAGRALLAPWLSVTEPAQARLSHAHHGPFII